MKPDEKAYTAVMAEIKRRTEIVFALHSKTLNVGYRATQIESMVLQVRMILELIALASLAAHRSVFEEQKRKFNAHWDPVRILRDVEKLNPHFYPQPLEEKPASVPGLVNELVDLKTGFLTRAELIEIHGRCGNILHARNPYAKPVDYDSYERAVPNWMRRIMTLLNCHKIAMYGHDDKFYLVHMKEEHDELVHMYTFGRVADLHADSSEKLAPFVES